MLFNDITGVLGPAQSWVEQQWTQRIVQISVYAAILFYVLSSLDLINKVDKTILNMLGVKLGKEGSRALHAVTLGFFMFVGIKFILDPFVKQVVSGQVVEGQTTGTCSHAAATRPTNAGQYDEDDCNVFTDNMIWKDGKCQLICDTKKTKKACVAANDQCEWTPPMSGGDTVGGDPNDGGDGWEPCTPQEQEDGGGSYTFRGKTWTYKCNNDGMKGELVELVKADKGEFTSGADNDGKVPPEASNVLKTMTRDMHDYATKLNELGYVSGMSAVGAACAPLFEDARKGTLCSSGAGSVLRDKDKRDCLTGFAAMMSTIHSECPNK